MPPAARRRGVEYENVFALGPMCGVADPDEVLAASARCDELGLDTISAGGTVAWAMECVERGLLDAPWLRFGDGAALMRALEEIGRREGLGELLAEGSRRAAEAVGHGSGAFAMQVKGLELPGYEPRTLQAMALGLAVNARGADHNRSGAYEADLSGELDRFAGGEAHVLAAVDTEDRAAVMDSMILCKFLRGVFTDPFREWAGPAAARSPAGTSTARSCAPPRAGSCWPSGCSTCARAGCPPTTGCRTGCCGSRWCSRRDGSPACQRTPCAPWSTATTPRADWMPRDVFRWTWPTTSCWLSRP